PRNAHVQPDCTSAVASAAPSTPGPEPRRVALSATSTPRASVVPWKSQSGGSGAPGTGTRARSSSAASPAAAHSALRPAPGGRRRAVDTARRALPLDEDVEREREEHAPERRLPREPRPYRAREEPCAHDGDRRRGRAEPDPVGALRPRDPAGGGRERDEQDAVGMEVQAETRAAREVEHEGEGHEHAAGLRDEPLEVGFLAAGEPRRGGEEEGERAQD